MAKRYRHAPVGKAELHSLVKLARDEEAAFFERNPQLIRPYRDRLLAVALCQGAALQYLKRGYGINDFDVHFFYAQNPKKPRLSRTVRRIYANVGSFQDVPVDFIRSVVPMQNAAQQRPVVNMLQVFLIDHPTSNAAHLSRKAVVGLLPAELLGTLIWPPTLL
jgi:hypothetical protein